MKEGKGEEEVEKKRRKRDVEKNRCGEKEMWRKREVEKGKMMWTRNRKK